MSADMPDARASRKRQIQIAPSPFSPNALEAWRLTCMFCPSRLSVPLSGLVAHGPPPHKVRLWSRAKWFGYRGEHGFESPRDFRWRHGSGWAVVEGVGDPGTVTLAVFGHFWPVCSVSGRSDRAGTWSTSRRGGVVYSRASVTSDPPRPLCLFIMSVRLFAPARIRNRPLDSMSAGCAAR